jgi:uncharacterized protein HemX
MIRLRNGVILALSIGLGLASLAMVRADDAKKSDDAKRSEDASKESKDSKEPKDEAIQQIDKLLKNFQTYRERTVESNENASKEIERQLKDLNELHAQRYQMLLLSAQVRARAAANGSSDDLEGRETLHRELRGVLAQLRSELETARTQTEQAVTQLNAIRAGLSKPKAGATTNAPSQKPRSGAIAVSDPG